MAYTFQQLVKFAEEGGFPANVAPTMAAIAIAESGGNNVRQQGQPYRTTGWGLWQITPGNSEPADGTDNALLNPVNNAKAAYAKYRSQGLHAWTTYTHGTYKKYLNGYPSGVGDVNGSGGADVHGSATASTDPFASVVDSLNSSIGAPFKSIADSLSIVDKLSLPATWVRIGAGFVGIGAVGFGVFLLAREVRS